MATRRKAKKAAQRPAKKTSGLAKKAKPALKPSRAPSKKGATEASKPARASKPVRGAQNISTRSIQQQTDEAIAWLRQHATRHTLEGMARYGLPSDKAFGVAVGDIKALGKRIGRNHELAEALWDTGWYEARMLTSFVDEPERVTPAQMDRWCRDFDNWGICDTLCFHLFDRTPHAWAKVEQWSKSRDEFVKRAAFALLASLALHDKKGPDRPFVESLRWIERGAEDERNFVKKGVSWALRGVGKRNAALRVAAVAVAKRLSASKEGAARWVGNDALKEFTRR